MTGPRRSPHPCLFGVFSAVFAAAILSLALAYAAQAVRAHQRERRVFSEIGRLDVVRPGPISSAAVLGWPSRYAFPAALVFS